MSLMHLAQRHEDRQSVPSEVPGNGLGWRYFLEPELLSWGRKPKVQVHTEWARRSERASRCVAEKLLLPIA